ARLRRELTAGARALERLAERLLQALAVFLDQRLRARDLSGRARQHGLHHAAARPGAGAIALEPGSQYALEALAHARARGQELAKVLVAAAEALEHLHEQAFFVAERRVDAGASEAGRGFDVGQRRALVAALPKQPERLVEHLIL